MHGWRMRLERRHPCLQRRGFRGVERFGCRILIAFSCFALMQAGMPAVQSHPPFARVVLFPCIRFPNVLLRVFIKTSQSHQPYFFLIRAYDACL
jgi:hypothetical protein